VILGLDTATAGTAVAVWAPGGPAVERRDDPPPGARPGHAGRLLALVEEALADAAAGWDGIERIAVGLGPGGFTGLRIGIATGRALAQAHDLPIVGVSSLRALAAGAAGQAAVIVAVIDARRGEVFAAAERWFDPAAIGPGDLAERIAGRLGGRDEDAGGRGGRDEGPQPRRPALLAVGDGAVRFRAELERAGAVVPVDGSPLHRVSALQVCRLGAEGEPAARDELLPDYRREPDATPPRLP
jgi:tRNA threonylcarbamoyladenosine biosynthesis protein TsaB